MKDSNSYSDNSSKLAYRLYSNNKPANLLLLHGFLGSQRIWDPMIMELSEHFNLLTLDLPGHGGSGCDQETITMSEMAEDVTAVLLENDFREVHVVGHSMGGYVGLELLNKHPKLVQSLSLLNSTAKNDNEAKKADRLRAVRVFDLSPRTYVKEAIINLFYEPNIQKFGPEVATLQELALQVSKCGAKASLRGMRDRQDYSEMVNSIETPIQYLAGKHDNTVPYASVVDQIRSKDIKLVTFENSGHMSFVEEKELCAKSIINFTQSI